MARPIRASMWTRLVLSNFLAEVIFRGAGVLSDLFRRRRGLGAPVDSEPPLAALLPLRPFGVAVAQSHLLADSTVPAIDRAILTARWEPGPSRPGGAPFAFLRNGLLSLLAELLPCRHPRLTNPCPCGSRCFGAIAVAA
ncbi:hypothetical protein FTUN_2119 [Frigoriglobus tundricola]|uniref:Uncharacterized protein n=1 Tax=Frigoriglobus tundricola TaxID=2774151 RepID=A0A6M5YKU8_9BACT|nr:hypothetical protein FTUN_2119 [Frigoriglobus tundricola]